MNGLLAYIPFLHPINALHDFWYLLVLPLSFGISVIYKAMRMPNLETFWRQVAIMTAQIVVSMAGMAVVLVVLFQLLIPHLPVG